MYNNELKSDIDIDCVVKEKFSYKQNNSDVFVIITKDGCILNMSGNSRDVCIWREVHTSDIIRIKVDKRGNYNGMCYIVKGGNI